MSPRQSSLAGLISIFLLVGCAAQGDAVAAGPAHPVQRGKPGAPVTVNAIVPHSIAVGVPTAVQIEATAAIDADGLVLKWVPSAGLVLGKTDVGENISDVKKDTVYRSSVTVSAIADGEYFLGVIATLRRAGSAQTRAVSIRINIGSAVMKAKPALQMDAQHNAIESMPAEESVSK